MNRATRSRRGSAREAKRAARMHGPGKDVITIRPGMEGGRYRPLSDHEVNRIHEAALDVLERIGMGTPTPLIRDLALEQGCSINSNGRLCFPRGRYL